MNAYLTVLDRELAAAGISGRRRTRILAEFEDHLESDPGADHEARLGEPAQIARQFADELGTARACGSAIGTFAALTVAGVAVVIRLALVGSLVNAGGGSAASTAAILIAVFAAQVAFVAGGLGFLRAVRLRRTRAIPRAEASVLRRRAAVGLGAGAVATLAFPLHATATSRAHTSTAAQTWLVVIGIVALGAAIPAIWQAARIRPQQAGEAGDVFDDLGALRQIVTHFTRASVTRFALLTAAAIGVVIAAAGIVTGDPFDGLLRAATEVAAYLACFALLGGYLGLRRAAD